MTAFNYCTAAFTLIMLIWGAYEFMVELLKELGVESDLRDH